ncbi:MAG: hypothetical protein IKO62_00565 [Bacteroidales bacterium]|nr:hypothetical protein [Bacteroidales bacterium]
MEKTLTLSQEQNPKEMKLERPRRSVIQNILNYSKAMQVVSVPCGVSFILLNN